jgi:hypothetical protein
LASGAGSAASILARRAATKLATRELAPGVLRAGDELAAEEGTAVSRAASCLNSFTGDTPVTMGDGSKKSIKEVNVGDKVLATDPITSKTAVEPVVQLIRHSGQHTMVDISLADGSVLDSTDGHPIWDATTGTFTDAGKLQVGHKIETDNGALITVTDLATYSADLTAYNLQIGTIHTYYAGATPVLVHNSCYSEDQNALIKLAKLAKQKGGTSMDDANALADWADELGLPGHGPAVHPGRSGFGGTTVHINIGPVKHIPVIP